MKERPVRLYADADNFVVRLFDLAVSCGSLSHRHSLDGSRLARHP